MDEAVIQDALLGSHEATATLTVDFFTSLDGNGTLRLRPHRRPR